MVAIVLAAGKSERFGGQKLLTEINGSTILGSTLRSLFSSKVDGIFVVLGHEAGEIRKRVDLRRTEVVVNSEASMGMSSSIKKGLAALGPDMAGVLMVLGDQPLVRPDTHDRLIDAYRAGDARAVVPVYQGRRGNPVLLDLSLRPQMETLEGDVGCRSILAGLHDIQEVKVDDPGVLVDVDTREDLKRALMLSSGGSAHG